MKRHLEIVVLNKDSSNNLWSQTFSKFSASKIAVKYGIICKHTEKDESWTNKNEQNKLLDSDVCCSCVVKIIRTHIPFNPYGSTADAEANKRVNRYGEAYYLQKKTDPALTYSLKNGGEIPLYRWAYRSWLFKKFDEGIQIDSVGYMDVTPEDVSSHIAQQMHKFTSKKKEYTIERSQTQEILDENLDKKQIELNNKMENIELIGALPEKTVHTVPSSGVFNVNKKNITVNDSFVAHSHKKEWVVDGCCGYGGNTISLAQTFEQVIAIDMDNNRLMMAKNNADIYGVNDNIEWIESDIIEWSETQLQDPSFSLALWLFLSPPWGGEHYKDAEQFFMRCCPCVDVYNMALKASQVAKNVCIYLPCNQNIDEIIQLASNISRCALTIIEFVSVGLNKITKYIIVYFLNEETALNALPNLYTDLSTSLLLELDEPYHMRPWFEFICKKIGINAISQCLTDTLIACKTGGINKVDVPDEKRSKGGVFFSIFKSTYPVAYKELNKLRKNSTTQSKGLRSTTFCRSTLK